MWELSLPTRERILVQDFIEKDMFLYLLILSNLKKLKSTKTQSDPLITLVTRQGTRRARPLPLINLIVLERQKTRVKAWIVGNSELFWWHINLSLQPAQLTGNDSNREHNSANNVIV